MREKTNEDSWQDVQGYVPFINIQLLHHLPIFVQAFFPCIRNVNIPFAILGKRATLHELNRVIKIYKKHIRNEQIYQNPKAQQGKPLRVETNYDSPPASASLTIDGKPFIGDRLPAYKREGKLNE